MKKYNLTYPQKNIWLMDKFDGKSNINVIAGAVNVSSSFAVSKCILAVNELIRTNETIRTSVFEENGQVFQEVMPYEYQEIEIVDTSLIDDSKKISYINDWILRPLFLGKNSKLYEFKIFDNKDGSGMIAFKIHHMLADAWTCSKIATLAIKYMESDKSEFDKIVPLYSYTNYITTEEEYKQSEKIKKDEVFWKEYLNDMNEVVSFKNNKKTNTTSAKRYTVNLDKELTNDIYKYCKENKISPYTLFLASLYTYIYRVYSKSDIVIGTPVLNRANFKEKQTFGLFISTVPMRVKIEKNEKILDLAKKIAIGTLSIFRHQRYPYSKTLEYVHENTNIKENLYNVLLSYQNAKAEMIDEEKYSTTWFFQNNINDELQIHITDFDDSGLLSISYDYKVELFEEKEVELIHKRLMNIIESAMSDNFISVENVNIISKTEKDILLFDVNNTSKVYNTEDLLIDVFEKNVAKNPDKIALVVDGKKYSYFDLDMASNNFADYLFTYFGVKENDIIPVIMKRDEKLVISLLAILKLGATYVPVDYKFPEARVRDMIDGASVILTNKNLEYSFDENINVVNLSDSNKLCSICKKENFDKELNKKIKNKLKLKRNTPSDKKIEYIIYTSGSTGKPKGVMVSSKNLINFLYGISDKLKFNQDMKMVSITTISFDIFGLEIWGSFFNGATLILANDIESIDQFALNNLCKEQEVNVIQTTPTKLKMLLTQSDNLEDIHFIKNMKKILIGGEAVPDSFVNYLRKLTSASIYDVYGPSETTIWSTVKDITCSKVNAGVPIQNTKLYIVDENERLLPLCCEGELCISGDSVAMGYFKREDLTDKVFKKLNFADEVVYKTGDLAKIDINYELTILGRVDFQVKINGQRVELEEIDKLIQENDEIKSCATVLNSDKKLVCFYVSKDGNKVEAEKLKESLLTKLPTYMVPNFYICLNEMPMTLNNKIDRKALIKMDIKKFMENEVEKAKVMPNTQIESLIYDAWKKVLKKDNFGIDDSFFELGTDSLDAINIQIELMSKNIHIEYSDLSKYQTIRKLAKKIEINESKIEYKIENFDKDYSNILQKNKEVYLPSKYNVKNVILSGATGFLGAHILAEILSSTNSKVFCLIRVKNGLSATKRIKNTLNYFFDDKYDKFIGTRIIPIEADITNMDNFGINKQDMDVIKNGDINFFVHSAACVKHYGRITNFSSINIGGTRAVANFCYENKINMIHISTLSVSGNAFETTYTRSTNTEAIFDESSFYQHQNLNNVYVYTKFRAEEIVLDYMEKGLNANILRIGNLTSRYYCPKFQSNVEENAFAGRIKTFIELGYMPDEKLNVEFSPIDLTAQAIIKIIEYFNMQNTIFHVFNHNHVSIKRLIGILKDLGMEVVQLPNDEFSKRIKDILASDKKYLIRGIINDLDEDAKLDYSSNVKIKCNVTKEYMKNIGYEWKKITNEYIINYLKCLRDSGFINF